ncbi:MAG: hypothetical protein QG671_728 [Actinomycetota bacterium]|jgi:hypothetical protein|nr:hypothetical protein [Actinomycetota bacterium]
MAHSWRYLKADGSEVVPLPDEATISDFPTQGEAESWIGEVWRDLLAQGVDAVTLVSDGVVVYGPMSLHPVE